MTKAKPLYPDTTLADRLREQGFSVQRCWQQRGPKHTGVAWHEALLAHASGRPGVLVIVQTYQRGGWDAFVPASRGNNIADTVDAVAAMCRA